MPTWSPIVYDLETLRHPQALSDIRPLLERLVEAFGAATVARMLDVDPAMITRWRRSTRMSAEMSQRILDLHDIFTRALQVMKPATVMLWLVGSNPHLGGARPIDVLSVRGITPVIDALRAFSDLGYA
jgi:uncharacterized protein (DUF2384 family)